MKKRIKPVSFYYGFPVFLVTTVDSVTREVNVTPMSSSMCLGDKIMIGVNKGGKSCENFMAGSDAVINIPDHTLWQKVEALGKLTGNESLTEAQNKWGVESCQDKLGKTGLTAEASEHVLPPAIAECPIQVECRVASVTDKGRFILVELDILQVRAESELVGENEMIISSEWKPLIYNFREYDTVGDALGYNMKYGH